MIVPSIDLMDGHAVQLIGGREKAIDAGDPRPIAERFRLAGTLAVIDLDAALGRGSNAGVIRDLVRLAPCRVGGGIRTAEAALDWLDAGAEQVILGTAAVPELLQQLPRERVVAALDADRDDVMVEGWRRATGRRVADRIAELCEFVSGFLVTAIEREGRLGGIDRDRAQAIIQCAGGSKVTIAGGVTTADDIAFLDSLGADAQVGMALYANHLDLADAIAAPLKSDRPDGLWPTIVVDEHGVALGLAWSSRESLREAVRTRQGVYQSRHRGLWIKGATSGATQELLRADLDCDRDCLRFAVRQSGAGFCHRNTRTCWGPAGGLPELARRLTVLRDDAPPGSYTRRLFGDATLLRSKLIEEAGELADADGCEHAAAEAADVIYFALVAATRHGATLESIETELDRRAWKVRRRPGNAKTPPSTM